MSITEELRDWSMDAHAGWIISRVELDALHAIADRIEAEHAKAVERARMDGMDATFGNGWVKLPVDADGVPIRVGDVMEGEKIGGGFGEPFEVVGYIMSNGELEPMDEHKCPRKHVYLRHHQPDSWERIIHDAFVESQEHFGSADAVAELVERCRRLAGDAE